MYKRETRFKGQKRVSVGRVTRNSDPPESRSKDSSRESSYEDSSRVVKLEPNFSDGSTDVAVSSAVQVSIIYRLTKSYRRESLPFFFPVHIFYRSVE